MSVTLTIGAAIPAYQNAGNLRQCLTSIREIAPAVFQRTVVVDDSGDGRLAHELQPEFPSIVWSVHERNMGFGASATEAVLSCRADIVTLLNDDVQLLNDPSAHLAAAFADPNLFAVTFQSRREDGSFREGAKRLIWPMGFPRILHNERDQCAPANGVYPSSYAVGGHAAFHLEKFRALSGFDSLFEPFYWEDVNLSLRARAQGWSITYCPDCVVMHGDGGAIRSSQTTARIREITLRNRLLFAWRHSPAHLRPLYFMSLAYHLLSSSLSADRTFLHAYKAARQRWQASLSSRTSP